jgi:hypothetical protein
MSDLFISLYLLNPEVRVVATKKFRTYFEISDIRDDRISHTVTVRFAFFTEIRAIPATRFRVTLSIHQRRLSP